MRKILMNLGLTEKEADVYLALLQMEDAGITKIASRSGIHRQVCYDILERLMEKGFASYAIKRGKKHFNALNPEKIIDILEEEKRQVKEILPSLLKIASKRKEEVSVELIKGKSVLKTIYNDIFRTLRKTGEKMLAMGIDEKKFLKFDESTIKQYIRNLSRYKLKEHLLSKNSAAYFFEGPQSVYRLLPDHMFNPNPIHIYGNKVAIIIWGNPVYGIVIKSKELADAHKKYFKLLWKMAKPMKK